jgi:ATP-dependent protease ClpP protease subunit
VYSLAPPSTLLTNLMIAELVCLHLEDPAQDVQLYINSPGCEVDSCSP